jgi:hypothetical protein
MFCLPTRVSYQTATAAPVDDSAIAGWSCRLPLASSLTRTLVLQVPLDAERFEK